MSRLMQCGLMSWLILTQTMSLGVTELSASEVDAKEGTQTNHQAPFPPLREFDGFRQSQVADRVRLALADPAPARPLGTDSPLVESYLLEGKLAEGNAALTARLRAKPNDDQALIVMDCEPNDWLEIPSPNCPQQFPRIPIPSQFPMQNCG